jgi:hypothetical protein
MKVHVRGMLIRLGETLKVDNGSLLFTVDDEEMYRLCSALSPGGCGDGLHLLDADDNVVEPPEIELGAEQTGYVYVKEGDVATRYELARPLDDADSDTGLYQLISPKS